MLCICCRRCGVCIAFDYSTARNRRIGVSHIGYRIYVFFPMLSHYDCKRQGHKGTPKMVDLNEACWVRIALFAILNTADLIIDFAGSFKSRAVDTLRKPTRCSQSHIGAAPPTTHVRTSNSTMNANNRQHRRACQTSSA